MYKCKIISNWEDIEDGDGIMERAVEEFVQQIITDHEVISISFAHQHENKALIVYKTLY